MTDRKHLNIFFEAIGIFTCLMFSIFIIYILSFYEQTNKHLFLQLFEVKLLDWQRFLTIIYGAAGLILGFFFFKTKNSIDETNSKNERARSLLELIHTDLMSADATIEKILNMKAKNSTELNSMRNDLDKIYYGIYSFLDCVEELVEVTEDERNNLVDVFSCVSRSENIYNISLPEFNQDDANDERFNYYATLETARATCIKKIGAL